VQLYLTLFARLQRNGRAEHRHRPIALNRDAAIALETYLHGRALVVGVGDKDALVARRVGHHKLVAAGRLQALEVVAGRAVLGALLVLGVEDVAHHHRHLGQAVLVVDEHLRADFGREQVAFAMLGKTLTDRQQNAPTVCGGILLLSKDSSVG
jgi:hypothetical protein